MDLGKWLSQEPSNGRVEIEGGKKNDFLEFVLGLREKMIQGGFKEVNLPIILDKGDLVTARGLRFYLNDYFFLSRSTRRVNIDGKKIRGIIPGISQEAEKEVLNVFHDYELGKFDVSDLPRQLVERAGILLDQAINLAKLVPLRMKTSSLTLRKELASSWLIALSHLFKRYPSPQAYFSIGLVFDPSLDVKARYSLSGVVVGSSSIFQVSDILGKMLGEYNLPLQTEQEIVGDTLFIPRSFHVLKARGHKIGYVANLSFTSLENFEILDPVVIFEIDLISMYRAMGREPLSSIYPYIYAEWYLPDSEIARHLRIAKKPETMLGREILVSLRKNIDLYSSQPAPCEFKVYAKEFEEKALEVYLVGYGKTLVGPGFNNELIVYKGDILALPTVGDHEAIMNGVRTGIRIGDAILNYIAREIERDPLRPREFKYDMATIENTNIYIPEQIMNYVAHIGADINFEVPVNLKVETRIKKLWVYKKGH